MVTFGTTIPALPSADMGRSVAFYRDRLGGDREFHVLDPDGTLVTFFEPGESS